MMKSSDTPLLLSSPILNVVIHAAHVLLSFRISKYRDQWLDLENSKEPNFIAIDNVVQSVDILVRSRTEDEWKRDRSWLDERLPPLLILLKMFADDEQVRLHLRKVLIPHAK